MTDDPSWWSDDDLFAKELGAALRDADVPQSVLRAGRAAFAWRTVDAELAELRLDDSLAEQGQGEGQEQGLEPEPAGLRGDPEGGSGGPGAPAPRALSFAARDLSVEVEIHADAVRGQLVPGQPGTVLVRGEDGPAAEVPADEVGWFVVRPVPAGRFRLHIRTAAGASVLTPWMSARP